MKINIKLLYILFCLFVIAWACKKPEEKTPITPTPNNTNKSSAKDIIKFTFAALSPSVDATIDATNKTISATVSTTTDLTKLVSTITLSDKATVSPASGVTEDFSKEVSYTVTAEDGSTQVYKINIKKEVIAVNVTSDLIFIGQYYSKILLKAFSIATGKEVWSFIPNTSTNTDANNPPYVYEGIVYIAGKDKKMYALDAKTGSKIWEYNIEINNTYPVSDNGILFCPGNDGKIYALDSKNGTKKWEVDLKSSPSSPVVINNIVYTSISTSGTSGVVYAFDVTNGALKWKQENLVSGSNVCVANDLVYVDNGDYGITALDAKTGIIIWKMSDQANSPQRGCMTFNNNILYYVTYLKGAIVALDAKTGIKKWRSPNYYDNGSFSNYTPIVVDGLIYIGSYDKYLTIDALTGDLKWSVSGYGYSNAIVAEKLVYSLNGVLDAKTGELKIKYSSGLNGNNFAVLSNGKSYHPGLSGAVQ